MPGFGGGDDGIAQEMVPAGLAVVGESSASLFLSMLPTILCVADNRSQAEQIVARLAAANVNLADTSLLFHATASDQQPAPGGKRDLSEGRGSTATQKATRMEPATSTSPATGTQTGAGAGAAAGATAAAATLAVPGLQPLVVTAPLVALAGAILGALFGAGAAMAQLASLGIMKSRQDHYQQRIDAGGYLVAVRTEDEAALTRALRVFEESHAKDIELFRLTKKLT